MKNFINGLIIFLVITTLVVGIPIKMFFDIHYLQYDSIASELGNDSYINTYTQVMELDNMDSNSKGLVMQMINTSGELGNELKLKAYLIMGYLVLLFSVALFVVGIITLKKFTDKKYVSKALITSSLFSIAAIIIFAVNVYSIYIKY